MKIAALPAVEPVDLQFRIQGVQHLINDEHFAVGCAIVIAIVHYKNAIRSEPQNRRLETIGPHQTINDCYVEIARWKI